MEIHAIHDHLLLCEIIQYCTESISVFEVHSRVQIDDVQVTPFSYYSSPIAQITAWMQREVTKEWRDQCSLHALNQGLVFKDSVMGSLQGLRIPRIVHRDDSRRSVLFRRGGTDRQKQAPVKEGGDFDEEIDFSF